jgi:4-hydroxymandelate synthase
MRPLLTASPAPFAGRQAAPDVELDALELWVADLGRTRRLLTAAFAFRPVDLPVDYGLGEERDETAACVVNGGVRVVLRQATDARGRIARHVAAHGDTVADVMLVCADPAAVAERAVAHGLTVGGTSDRPRVDLFGDGTICHTVRPTALVPVPPVARDGPQMRLVDHVGYCLPWGLADQAARIYQKVFGLQCLDADSFDAVGDEATGMRSVVLRSAAGFTVVLTEPVSQTSTGQTQRFVDAHAGPGVQHAALAYEELFTAVETLRSSGVEFLPIPGLYYDQAQQRSPNLPINWQELRRLEILVDADHDGLLYQLFTRPITGRGTFFFELIQRSGATGFGINNVRALFAAVQATMDGGS